MFKNNKHFQCPNCHSKQNLKHLYWMSKYSMWPCHSCGVQLKPKNISIISNLIGILIVVIPANIMLYRWHFSLWKTFLICMLIGGIFYLFSLIYFYRTTELEQA